MNKMRFKQYLLTLALLVSVGAGAVWMSAQDLGYQRVAGFIFGGATDQTTAGVFQGEHTVTFQQGATPADALDTVFFQADRNYKVTKITASWSTAETTGSMDIMVEKLTGTTACASGTDLMASVIAGTGTANTVNTATLTATAADLLVATGNRLCVDLTATPNEVANMVVSVTLRPN